MTVRTTVTKDDLANREKCSHSHESILLLLNRAPLRLSIKEISSITKWHRNTIRAQLNELKEENKIKFMGAGNHSVYYTNSVIDHYRKVAKTLYESIKSTLPEEHTLQILKEFGKNLVKNSIEAIFGNDQKQSKHILDIFAKFKMSYPFNDIVDCCSAVNFIPGELYYFAEDEMGQPQFEITFQINPCLCKGEKDYAFACAMVEGAFEGSLEVIGNYHPLVEKINHQKGPGDEFCTFRIKTDEQDNFSI